MSEYSGDFSEDVFFAVMHLSYRIIAVVVIFSLGALLAEAHVEHSHSELHGETKSGSRSSKEIRALYVRDVKLIFARSCMDCHSGQTHYPWYVKIPGVKHFIESDVNEARKHLDMTNDYPFASHATPQEDLRAIREDVLKGSMPPFAYRLLHPGSGLSDGEKQVIFNWIEQAEKLLE